MARKSEQAKAVEAAVADALLREDFDEAERVAGGHPDPSEHVRLLREIGEIAGRRKGEDLAGPPPSVNGASRMFEIRRKAAKIASFNPRAEKSGSENRPAADLKLSANLAATMLDALDPSLRAWLFCKSPGPGDDLADAAHEAPNLRQPRIAAQFDWVPRYAGYELRIHDLGLDESSDLVISGCEFNRIRLAPQEGGTVIVSWRLQFHPTEAQAGKLSTLIQETLDISLLAPEGAGEVDDSDEGSDEE